jgi:hypothetical protein
MMQHAVTKFTRSNLGAVLSYLQSVREIIMFKFILIGFLLFPINALSEESLHNKMLSLDQQMFDSFNKCTDKL